MSLIKSTLYTSQVSNLSGLKGQAVELTSVEVGGVELVKAPQGGDSALLGQAGLIAKSLHELNVAARTGVGDFDKHAVTLSKHNKHVNTV